jgi:hypothetical protein
VDLDDEVDLERGEEFDHLHGDDVELRSNSKVRTFVPVATVSLRRSRGSGGSP